jgi:protein ImuA
MAGGANRLSSGAETRFEVLSRAGPHLPSARGLPLPGPACWSIRIVKARAGPDGFGFDRDRFLAVLWDHEKACFRDAFPLPLAPPSRNRSDHPADARARLGQTA